MSRSLAYRSGASFLLLALVALLAQDGRADDHPEGKWVDMSAGLLAQLDAAGLKTTWPGKTAGVTVDPSSGDVFLVVPGQGLWKSQDHGGKFARIDGKLFSGRCETGATMQFDPAGKRLACFFLDGHGGMSLDGGATWARFADEGRNWDYGSVDWSAEKPVDILVMRHESGGELWVSHDAGAHWKKIAKDPAYNSVGELPERVLLTSKRDGGIFRSADDGSSWNRTSDFTVVSHVPVVYKKAAYLIAKEGLIASEDGGKTWASRGKPVEASFGPVFKSEKQMVVWGKGGIFRSDDGGATWAEAAPIPKEYHGNAEWFVNVGWDPGANILYTSRMSFPAYRWEH